MNIETRVGYATTTLLENHVRDYIIAHTIKGYYVGNLKYLIIMQDLVNYNKREYNK